MARHAFCGKCGSPMVEGKTALSTPVFDRDTGQRKDGGARVWVCAAYWSTLPNGTTVSPYPEHDFEMIGKGVLATLRRAL